MENLKGFKKRNFLIEYPYETEKGELKTWS